VLAHTPFRRLAVAGKLRDRPVLVAGVGDPAGVATEYGFRQVGSRQGLRRFCVRSRQEEVRCVEHDLAVQPLLMSAFVAETNLRWEGYRIAGTLFSTPTFCLHK
jgi:hypothetical protein